MKAVSDLLLNLMGWEINSEIPDDIKKAVIIVAPHTSYMDFFIGKLGFWHMEVESKLLIKSEAFKWPYAGLLKKLGGLPVNRNQSTKLTDTVASMFNEHDSLFISITPEGTRKLVKEWKRGFYYIALAAKVPIILGVLDYKTKKGGMKKLFYPTGDYQKDIVEIKAYYKGHEGKNPKKSMIID
ncbi:MAG: 1-acyl-sn-glycerol-3-phosphate acyltransferase [Bacteroidetes bacterium]|nr:1-acyl-sn-glycerol-3-phosphate acyltransferase [Bacteroidota bacterium]MBL6943641.1 1-acyl-sn-glycerol-3-phosphate acyltransferase [Bacteroidales bacterium]